MQPEEEDTLHPEPSGGLAEGDTSIVSVEEIRSALEAEREAEAAADEDEEPHASIGQRILAALLIVALAALIVVLVVKGLAR